MLKTLNALFLIIALGFVSIALLSCDNSKTKADPEVKVVADEDNQAADVRAYYFHATRRCATCEAVESVTVEALKEYYGTKVTFQSINSEEDSENPMLAQYKISGQTLLIIKGNKVVDLTNDAFLNARTNPDKFKAKLKSTLDPMM